MKERKCEMLFNSLYCYQMIFVYAKCLNILSCSYHPCLVACSGVQYMLSCVFVLFFFVLYLFSTRAFHLEYFSCTGIVAISFIGVENYRPVASHWQNWPQNVASSTPRHERDSNSQLYWWYTLIAQVDVNPATMRSRPRRPLPHVGKISTCKYISALL